MLKIITSQWAKIAVMVGSALILTPFVIGKLGAEGYGVWILINALTGYLTLLSGGLPASAVRHFSEHVADGDRDGLNRAIASSFTLFGAMAALVVFAGAVLFAVYELAYDVPRDWSSDGRAAFVLATLAIAVPFVVDVFMTIMEAHGDYVARNTINIVGVLVRVGLTLVLLWWRASVTLVAAAALLSEVFSLVASVGFVRRRYPDVRVSLSARDPAMMRSIFSFSMVLLVLLMGSQLAYSTDALVIGYALPIGAVSVYSVANTLAMYVGRLVGAVAEPLMPRATVLRRKGAVEELQVFFLTWSKIGLSIAMLVGLYLAFLGPEFITWWISRAFGDEGGAILVVLVTSFIVMLPASSVALRILMGITRPIRVAVTFLATGLLNLAISIVLVRRYGLLGVAVGTAIPNLVFAAVVVPLACREMGVRVRRYLGYVVWRPLLATVPLAGVLAAFKLGIGVDGLAGLLVSGVVYVACFALLWVLYVYRRDPYLDLSAKLDALLGRNRQPS